MNKSERTALIKQEALRLGFNSVGISKADFLVEEAPRLERWLKSNQHGKMSYMERNFDKRLDPRLLVDDAKSVISFTLNYFPKEEQKKGVPQISKYAYGRDYHFVIKEKLKELTEFIRSTIGEVNGRAFVDSAPVLDRSWAKKSGLGWVGKNSNLIHPKSGSFFFIAELIVDLELDFHGPMKDYCGTCTRCIDACPTQAIVAPQIVDGSKCISYFTIEIKDAIPSTYKNKFQDWAFGCDTCQDVCPWNRFSYLTTEKSFSSNQKMLEMSYKDWEEITEETFKKVFTNSAVKRTKYEGLKRNIKFLR